MQNKGPKKGKIGLPKSLAKTSAPPNLVLLMRAFWDAYFSFFGAFILQFGCNFSLKHKNPKVGTGDVLHSKTSFCSRAIAPARPLKKQDTC